MHIDKNWCIIIDCVPLKVVLRLIFAVIMSVMERFLLKGQNLWLTAERCIYWEEQHALILSDLHLGKTGHFRKAGIAVPQELFKKDLHRLFSQIQYFKASTLIIVGDLFHSHANKELDLFLKWRKDKPDLKIRLIKGNHDILSKKTYETLGIEVTNVHLNISPFCFTHDISSVCDEDSEDHYVFSGHIHPGVHLSGLGRQSLAFPCFYFNRDFSVLPAFSLFTGASKMKMKAEDQVFALVNNEIIKMGSGSFSSV